MIKMYVYESTTASLLIYKLEFPLLWSLIFHEPEFAFLQTRQPSNYFTILLILVINVIFCNLLNAQHIW